MKNKISVLVSVLSVISASSGCNTSREVVYLQDFPDGAEQQLARRNMITVQPGDQLSIMVYGDNAELASTFNLNIFNANGNGTGPAQSNTRVYTIDSKGNIKMPVLGSINIAGKTREEISATIENELTTRNLLRNPVVNVAYYNMCVYVLGEVGGTRQVAIEKDVVTLPEVLAKCGDLTINGRRDSIKVIREIDDRKIAMTVDLRSAGSVYESPAYYLQPDDLVYVIPNKTRTNQSSTNANAARTPSFWISIITFLTSMGVLIFK